MLIEINYHGWLIEKLNTEKDILDYKPNIRVIDLIEELKAKDDNHSKYLDEKYIRVSLDNTLVNDLEKTIDESVKCIDIIVPIAGG